jgi:hypothetical protein
MIADRPMAHFSELTRDELATAIRRLAASGLSDHTLAHATGLAVEQVRAVIGSTVTHGTAFAVGRPADTRSSGLHAAAYPTPYPERPAFSPERTRNERG